MMLDIKMYPLPSIWLESWNHTTEGMIEVNSGKNRSDLYHMRQITWLDWSKTATQFSVNSHGKFLSCHKASRRASKWTEVFPSLSLKQILFSNLVSYFSKICCTFNLGKCLLDSKQLLLIFTEVWLYNFHVPQ